MVFHWGKFKLKVRNGYYSCMKFLLCCYHISCAKTDLIVIRSRTCSIYSHSYVLFSITLFNWFKCVSFITRKYTILFFFCLTKYNNHLTSFQESKTGIPMRNLSGDSNEYISHCLLNNTSNSLFHTIYIFCFCLHFSKERVRSGATPTFASIKTPF